MIPDRGTAGASERPVGRRWLTGLAIAAFVVVPGCSSGRSSPPSPTPVQVAARASALPAGAPAARSPMIRVEAGSFVRGHDDAERRDESPAHRVHLHAFYIESTLVTRRDFATFVDETRYVTSAELAGVGIASYEGLDDWAWERVPHGSWRKPFRDPNEPGRADGGPDVATAVADHAAFLRDDAPVVMVSYEDAVAYCAHYGARLPTEAEWELAMRAGAEKTRYPWGDSPEDATGKLALNFWQGTSHHHNLRLDGFVYVSPVRAFAPNRLGIYDPVGNVWQWTADYYAKDTYRHAHPEITDPKGPPTGETRVLRGGSWWCGACTCEGNGLFYRGKAAPKAAFNNNGFRCAKDASSP